GKYFNDRLVSVIDHLLAAPEPAGPVALVQPKIIYKFADPQLESLLEKLNLAKLLFFQALCQERSAATAQDQLAIANEVVAWQGAFDTTGAFRSARHRLKGANPISVDDYLNSRLPQP
ncbi:MAG TPA: DUF3014 domain-containing protein, partial [Pirellulales bacterium]|nr:DUF3014 domain-containing protein [Pirellulales bacterium]